MQILHAPLTPYLNDAAPKPFGYGPGELDCSRFVAEWLEAIGKGDAAKSFDYRSAKEAASIIKSHGGLNRLSDDLASQYHIIELDDPESAKYGDVGIVKHGRKKVFAICASDGRWVCKTNRGVVIAPMKAVKAWRVTGAGVGAELVGSLILTAIGLEGFTLFGLSAAATATTVGSIVLAAASIGIQYALAQMNKPKQDPQNNQQSVRQAAGARMRHYGTVKVGGTIVFSESYRGLWYEIVVTGSGEIDAIIETWAADKKITLLNGVCQTEPWGRYLSVYSMLGTDTQTAYNQMAAKIPEWTSAHRLLGLSSFLRVLSDPGQKYFGRYFQGGIPKIRQVLRAAKVYDPRIAAQSETDKSTWQWSDNPALCILDYLTNSDGYGLSIADCDLGSFSDFADLCDENIRLKSGAFERRYRMSGSYSFAEPRKDVVRRMLATCDGQVVQLPNGKIGITGGRYIEPEVTITSDHIVGASFEYGNDATERANEIKPIYVSASHDFQEVEAPTWRDDDAIIKEGLVSQQLPLTYVPSHTQAQRLAKIAGRRINTARIGKLRCNLGGLLAYQQRFIRIAYAIPGDSDLFVDGVFIVDSFEFVIEQGSVGVSISVTQVDPSDWDWDEQTEEGEATPTPPDTGAEATVEVPQDFGATVIPVTVSVGVTGGQFSFSWTAPEREGMTIVVQYRQRISAGPDVFGNWVENSFPAEDETGLSSVIQNDGSLYEVRAQYLVTGGAPGDWSTTVSVIANADPVAPDQVAITSATGGPGSINVAWTNPNSANFSAAKIYWNTSNTLNGATLVATVYGAPSSSGSRNITGVSAGTRYVLITSINGSGVASAAVNDSAVVT